MKIGIPKLGLAVLLLANFAAAPVYADQDDDRSRHAERVARAREVIAQAHAAQDRVSQRGGQPRNLPPDAANRGNATAPGSVEEYQRAARLSDEERRTLRQQINDAGRTIYANPTPTPARSPKPQY